MTTVIPRFERLDLNLLLVLDALLTERNVTRAGLRVGLTQPATSNALARLRRVFEDELLVRIGHELELTAQAKLLAQPVHEILRLIRETIEEEPTFIPESSSVRYRVAASDHVALLLVAPALSSATDTRISVDFTDLPTGDALGLLTHGDLDLVVGEAPVAMPAETLPLDGGPALHTEHLYSDRWVCLSWRGDAGIDHPPTVDELGSLPHLGYGIGPAALPSPAERQLREAGVTLRIMTSTDSFLLGPLLLVGTPCLTIVPELLARRAAARHPIAMWPLPIDLEPLDHEMVWASRSDGRPQDVWLRARLTHVARHLRQRSLAEAEAVNATRDVALRRTARLGRR